MQIMGARLYQVQHIRPYANREPLTIVFSLGRMLTREKFKREVRIGRYYCDFANDINRVIEIDGMQYHDIVADIERDIYLKNAPFYCIVMRIKAVRLDNDSAKVQADVMHFLTY